ncbi:origin recognition complex subunit 4 [Lecanora helva]
MMEGLEASSRPSKRRKTSYNGAITQVNSRALQNIKQVVYGKPQDLKSTGETLDEVAKTRAKATYETLQEEGTGKEEKAAKTGLRPKSNTRPEVHATSNQVDTSSSSAKPGRRFPRDGRITDINAGEGRNTEVSNTPTEKDRKKVKGWVYIEDKDALSQNEVSGSSLQIDSEVGRVKRGHNDLTIDMKPQLIHPRGVQSAADNAEENADGSAAGRIRRTPRKIGSIDDKAIEENTATRSVSRVKERRQKRRLNQSPTQLGQEDDVYNISNAVGKDASPDELAYSSREEDLDHDSTPRTSKGRPMKRTQFSKRIITPSYTDHVEHASQTLIQEKVDLDLESALSSHAHTLRLLLDKGQGGMGKLKTHILAGLTGRRRLLPIGLQNEHQKIKKLAEQTILAGEGNSMLIVGSRGSGKTLLVETVIAELSSDHRDDFHVVRLNGFIHTDDKIALREIWRQLGREMAVDTDDLGGRSNYADTLTSLLALLAHPATEKSQEDQAATARSVVFILDEFDLFAAHARQTLLYNLFDIAQSRNAPIAILGLTTKVNVVDSLEKRVKSRFGQRYVHLSLARNYNDFQDICLSALKCHPSTQDLLQDKNSSYQQISTAWNNYIESLISTAALQHFLQSLYTTTKSVPAFLNASLLPISALSPNTLPAPSSFISQTIASPDSKLHLLPTLSTLALSLLIAAARLDVILSTDVCTFSMTYEEYVTLASKSRLQSSAAGQMAVGGGGGGARIWSKEMAKGAWEELGGLELVLPAVGGGGSRGLGRGKMWRVDVGLEEIGVWLEREGGKGGVLGKWCREI